MLVVYKATVTSPSYQKDTVALIQLDPNPRGSKGKDTHYREDGQLKKRILAVDEYNKHNFICIVLMSWPVLCESENIKQMITLVTSN